MTQSSIFWKHRALVWSQPLTEIAILQRSIRHGATQAPSWKTLKPTRFNLNNGAGKIKDVQSVGEALETLWLSERVGFALLRAVGEILIGECRMRGKAYLVRATPRAGAGTEADLPLNLAMSVGLYTTNVIRFIKIANFLFTCTLNHTLISSLILFCYKKSRNKFVLLQVYLSFFCL